MSSVKLPFIIQLISISGSTLFLFFIIRLIVKGKLREEYSIIWIVCTFFLLLFSFWRQGLDIIANYLGIYYAPSLIFLGAIFAIVLFLVHLSVVNSKLQRDVKELTHEIAFLKQELNKQTTNE